MHPMPCRYAHRQIRAFFWRALLHSLPCGARGKEESSTVEMVLTVPREQLCFACHERSAMEQHWAMGQKACLDCHDAHRSARAMLLRRNVDVLQNPMEPSSWKGNTKTGSTTTQTEQKRVSSHHKENHCDKVSTTPSAKQVPLCAR